MARLLVEVPEGLLYPLGPSRQDAAAAEIRVAAPGKLHELGRLPSGAASGLARVLRTYVSQQPILRAEAAPTLTGVLAQTAENMQQASSRNLRALRVPDSAAAVKNQ